MTENQASILSIYQKNPPSYLEEFLSAPERIRLSQVNRHCGREYTSFPFFKNLPHYSRLVHSIGVSYLLSRFTDDPKIILSGLFHDIATPSFAHVIDFLLGDHLRQEATESRTEEIIKNSLCIQKGLSKLGLKTEDVSDYHLYPLADNDSPKLSADRLEYSLSNFVNFGFASPKEVSSFVEDLTITQNEEGVPEIAFRSLDKARKRARLALRNGQVYTCDEDRYGREYLAHVLKQAMDMGVLSEEDLYTTEDEVIQKLLSCEKTKALYQPFQSLSKVRISQKGEPFSYCIPVKKRFIDPFVVSKGRLSSFVPEIKKEREDFASLSFDYYLSKAD